MAAGHVSENDLFDSRKTKQRRKARMSRDKIVHDSRTIWQCVPGDKLRLFVRTRRYANVHRIICLCFTRVLRRS